jgi:hypothetical protein
MPSIGAFLFENQRVDLVRPGRSEGGFGIADVHDFHPGMHFYFNGLSKDHVLHARQNYNIMILFFCLLSVML